MSLGDDVAKLFDVCTEIRDRVIRLESTQPTQPCQTVLELKDRVHEHQEEHRVMRTVTLRGIAQLIVAAIIGGALVLVVAWAYLSTTPVAAQLLR